MTFFLSTPKTHTTQLNVCRSASLIHSKPTSYFVIQWIYLLRSRRVPWHMQKMQTLSDMLCTQLKRKQATVSITIKSWSPWSGAIQVSINVLVVSISILFSIKYRISKAHHEKTDLIHLEGADDSLSTGPLHCGGWYCDWLSCGSHGTLLSDTCFTIQMNKMCWKTQSTNICCCILYDEQQWNQVLSSWQTTSYRIVTGTVVFPVYAKAAMVQWVQCHHTTVIICTVSKHTNPVQWQPLLIMKTLWVNVVGCQMLTNIPTACHQQ